MATVGYGIGCWHLCNENIQKARTDFEKIVSTNKHWLAFGFKAVEAELVRMRE